MLLNFLLTESGRILFPLPTHIFGISCLLACQLVVSLYCWSLFNGCFLLLPKSKICWTGQRSSYHLHMVITFFGTCGHFLCPRFIQPPTIFFSILFPKICPQHRSDSFGCEIWPSRMKKNRSTCLFWLYINILAIKMNFVMFVLYELQLWCSILFVIGCIVYPTIHINPTLFVILWTIWIERQNWIFWTRQVVKLDRVQDKGGGAWLENAMHMRSIVASYGRMW